MKTKYQLIIHSNSGELICNTTTEQEDIIGYAKDAAKVWALHTFSEFDHYDEEHVQETQHYAQHHSGKAITTRVGFRYVNFEHEQHENLIYDITAVEL